MDTLLERTWHHLDREAVLEILDSDATRGLRPVEVDARQGRFGPNVLTGKRGPGPLFRFALQFHAPLVYVLLGATVATALLGEWVDSGVIFGVVLVNAVLGFVQENKALQAIESLSRRMASEACVVRDGEIVRVPSASLVPGDVVLLQSGDRVPADVRLLEARDLRVDESALTGESVPVEKSLARVEVDATLADRTNLAYASTFVTYGRARAIVVATGNRTELGRISRMLSGVEPLATPLTRKIAHFSRILLVAILVVAAVGFAAGVARGESANDMFMAAVALAVGAIPEGLPAAVTIILAIGVARMARQNALIRKLPAVETLGSTTVICSDKTGTLTRNQMTVQAVATSDGAYEVSGAGYAPEGSIVAVPGSPDAEASVAVRECMLAGLLCNDAQLKRDPAADSHSIAGDPTEGALVVAAAKVGMGERETCAWRRLDTVPFESEHQYMATLHRRSEDGAPIAYVKGSLERILDASLDALDEHGAVVPLDRQRIEESADRMAASALRVIAMARVTVPDGTTTLERGHVESGLTFLGLEGMIDPPRPDAVQAVAACRRAGIAVKMITGDHAKTAAAIAEQIGLGDGRVQVVTGKELAGMADDDLASRLPKVDVFARVAPEHKLRIVRALQAAGHVVAMTGDGVNDAPALKQADIGVAMGLAGTDVAKEAADMVLTDDNFASIAAAVEQGRGVFDNLRKFILWTIPTNIGEGLVIAAAIALGAELPILPLQILWINMTTAVLLGMTLAFEPREADVMQRPPRAPTRPLLTPELLKRTGLVSLMLLAGAFGLYEYELATGATLAQARTVATNVFIAVEAFYLLNCRSLLAPLSAIGLRSNPWVWAGIGAMAVLQLAFTYAPPMNDVFGSAPIGVAAWLRVLGVGAIAFLVVGVEKALRRRVAARASAR